MWQAYVKSLHKVVKQHNHRLREQDEILLHAAGKRVALPTLLHN
jgi:hypothetical protein